MSIIAKYKFDGSVYADLIPEFNAEFTSDLYTITDEGNIIKDINWLSGYQISIDTGEYFENPNCHSSDFINVYFQGLKCTANQPVDIFWYDENKNYISGLLWDNNTLGNNPSTLMECPENAHYVRLSQYASRSGLIITAGEIIRTIESDELPTLMRFGRVWVSGETDTDNRTDSLLEVLDMNTSGLTDCSNMFRYNKNLTSISCEWDTSNATAMNSMFGNCNNLTSLDVSNFDTSKVTNMNYMFDNCINLTSLDVSNFNTSKVTTMLQLFCNCNKLTSLDVSNFDTSNVTSMQAMFYNCNNLTTLDLSNFDTSKVTSMNGMFSNCNNLTTLDLSNFDTSKVTNMNYMFDYCVSLTILDISNFTIKNSAITDSCIIYNDTKLSNVGMIYCDKDTINRFASLQENIPRTIWVESDDILQYDQYDHITYKTQKVQDTVHLNSPLLMGDTIEVIDGKTYHVHRYEKVVLDGSEDWIKSDTNQIKLYKTMVKNSLAYCDKLPYYSWSTSPWNLTVPGISFAGDAIYIYHHDKQWLQANPTTVIYELKTPYYELISEETLELTLLDTTDNTINNNSILPSNMNIANKELSTIAIKPSTTYTLAFDKSNEDSEITIDICGGEQITTVLNRVELTTPSELGSGIRFISSDGCIVSNVRLLEGSLVEEAIPKESFEGLQSSFYDGYIIGENLIKDLTPIWHSTLTHMCYYKIVNIKENTNYTLINPKIYDDTYFYVYSVTTENGSSSLLGYQSNKDNPYIRTFNTKTNTSVRVYCRLKYMDGLNLVNEPIEVNLDSNWYDLVVLEGDHTHLSEAELMRYIEKGTSHYEEEDYNHIGKYKVEYKVTGKNKFNPQIDESKSTSSTKGGNTISYSNGVFTLVGNIDNDGSTETYSNTRFTRQRLKPFTEYILSYKSDGIFGLNGTDSIEVHVYQVGSDDNVITSDTSPNRIKPEGSVFVTGETGVIAYRFDINQNNTTHTFYELQVEEGTVATEYEPYKEDIKTYYLSSPLLEGDTIEDVNGVATHVKRYGKVVLDGSEDWTKSSTPGTTTCRFYTYINNIKLLNNNYESGVIKCSDKFRTDISCEGSMINNIEAVSSTKDSDICVNIKSIDNTSVFKQWLQQNPTTVVYELAEPYYELISEESILCDSYVNGHLDLDSDIPVEKVDFRCVNLHLQYLQPNVNYTIQFNADNTGVISYYMNGAWENNISVAKGLNKIITNIIDSSLNYNNLDLKGIGFNASNIQVVANTTHENGDVKEFDYFKGLKSTFEDKLITDENDEHYGQYAVDVKVVGKNKINIASIEYKAGVRKGGLPYICKFTLKPNTNYTFSWELDYPFGSNIFSAISNENLDANTTHNQIYTKYANGHAKSVLPSFNSGNYKYLYITASSETPDKNQVYSNFQLEEGSTKTPYEPYKESSYTIYLNSPLLKDDTIEVVDGKLSHVHRYGMVVLDGSENNENYYLTSAVTNNINTLSFIVNMYNDENINKKTTDNVICDIFYTPPNLSFDYANNDNVEMIESWLDSSASFIININKSKLPTSNLNGFKQWLQANPTTVIYELATPTVENIEPIQSGFVLSSVKEGDMTIDTALPIKVDLEYRTNMAGTSALEEQLANVQNGADLIDIINSEVDE